MSTHDGLDVADRVGLHMDHCFDRDSVRDWEQSLREPTASRSDDATEVINAVLRFLADGLSFGNMPERGLALLLVVRPDLVNGCSYGELAAEVGKPANALHAAVKQLRDEFPGLRGGYGYAKHSEHVRFLRGRYRRHLIEKKRTREILRRAERRHRLRALDDMRELDARLGLASGNA